MKSFIVFRPKQNRIALGWHRVEWHLPITMSQCLWKREKHKHCDWSMSPMSPNSMSPKCYPSKIVPQFSLTAPRFGARTYYCNEHDPQNCVTIFFLRAAKKKIIEPKPHIDFTKLRHSFWRTSTSILSQFQHFFTITLNWWCQFNH